MGQGMTSQVAIPAEDLAARGTLIGFVIRVGEQMGFQVGALIERTTADGALVWRFLHVQDLVDSQGPRLAEALAAFRAFEGFLLGVDIPGKS